MPTITIEHLNIELQPGEHYAGPVIDATGHTTHHMVLLAERPDTKLTWQLAMVWAASLGGSLPSRQEQALLIGNCGPHLEGAWYWSSDSHEGNASYAWDCYFTGGNQAGTRKSDEGSAVAVRRIPITALSLHPFLAQANHADYHH